ncbi:M23 family metallopeptidase [Salipaludibacillus sp. CUR1]|uniref:M23 family metallopeptidase n=1 Tax=Salipaludibacillus sp. CUR1 TaxID=2820003 RepID=UPI001E4456E3|nr:M23 family metallopeptidase [Salipaludibacillus sp. CUR1]MCE7791348.1 M23 family metallopeptidase [Salipaludibacillus sp. CUR1]
MQSSKRNLLSLSVAGVIVLAACGENSESSSQAEWDSFSPEEFPDVFLAGEFERTYEQTSNEFQENVSYDEFQSLGEDFSREAGTFKLVSDMELNGLMEYQWMNSDGTKGIRSYFSEDFTIEGLRLMPLDSPFESESVFTENTYRMPVNNNWVVFWGGTNELVNYHYPYENQRYAYDLVVKKDGSTFRGDPEDNESYHAFEKVVLAPASGKVVSVEDGIPDNTPQIETNEEAPLGNHVIIEHGHGEFSVIGHCRKNSLIVSEGDEVFPGDIIGLAGNSGNSSEPHIHFHVADDADWQEAKSLRIRFNDGEEPVRGDEVTGF